MIYLLGLSRLVRTHLKKVFSPPSGLAGAQQLLEIHKYSCGLMLGFALIWNKNLFFEIGSDEFFSNKRMHRVKHPGTCIWLRSLSHLLFLQNTLSARFVASAITYHPRKERSMDGRCTLSEQVLRTAPACAFRDRICRKSPRFAHLI